MVAHKDVDAAVHDLVGLIRKTEDYKKAYWSIQHYGGGKEESFVRANRAGALLFAADLLAAALETPHPNGHAGRGLSDVEQEGDVQLDYLELVTDEPTPPSKEGIKPKVIGGALLLCALFALLCLVIGFKNIVMGQW